MCYFVFKVFYSMFVCPVHFWGGVLGKRLRGFDPDVVVVVYIIAHAWVNFTAHGQLILHIL